MNTDDISIAEAYAMAMYANEPCRICGEMIKLDQVRSGVFAGYSVDNKSRFAHGQCWNFRKNDKANWAYPHDAVKP